MSGSAYCSASQLIESFDMLIAYGQVNASINRGGVYNLFLKRGYGNGYSTWQVLGGISDFENPSSKFFWKGMPSGDTRNLVEIYTVASSDDSNARYHPYTFLSLDYSKNWVAVNGLGNGGYIYLRARIYESAVYAASRRGN